MFGDWSEEWGHEAVQSVFARPGAKPDAIFCGSDEIARGVIDALRDLNVEIPRMSPWSASTIGRSSHGKRARR